MSLYIQVPKVTSMVTQHNVSWPHLAGPPRRITMSTDALHTQRQITCVSGRHGWANFCQIDETSAICWQWPVWRATPSNKIRRESVLFFWPVRMERSPCWNPWRNLHSYLQEEIENFLFLLGVWLYMTSFYVTIVMHLRSYSSGGATKFLTWTLNLNLNVLLMHISWVPSILVWYDVMWCWCVWFQSWSTSSVLVMSTAAASTCRDVIVTWHDTNHVFSTAPFIIINYYYYYCHYRCCCCCWNILDSCDARMLFVNNEWMTLFCSWTFVIIMQTKTWASFVVERLNNGYLPSVFSRIHTSVAPSCRF